MAYTSLLNWPDFASGLFLFRPRRDVGLGFHLCHDPCSVILVEEARAMKKVIYENFGNPAEVLKVVEEPSAPLEAGQCRVEVLRSPINPCGLIQIAGEYAVKLYHDVNGDGEMNTNPFGMPVEPFAFSNDAKGRFGPAKWDAAKFTVGADAVTHTITMN